MLCQYVVEFFNIQYVLHGVIDFPNLKNVTIGSTIHCHVAFSRRFSLFSTAYVVSRSERDADHQPDFAQLKRL